MTARAIPIVALDVASGAEALSLARTLGETCRFYKVGSELFTAEGPAIVRSLVDELGVDVFLDLKFHDIPNTVAGAIRRAAGMGVRLATVHAGGGRAMLEAALEATGARCSVLAVTILTSLDDESLANAWGRSSTNVETEVVRLAAIADEAGLHGVVCSGSEAAAVRAACGDGLAILVPAIRLAGDAAHDQRRVVTPGAAQAAGAHYIVLGRTVTAATDPRAAMARVLTELREGGGAVASRGG